MDTTSLYDIKEVKRMLNKCMVDKTEPELCFTINGNTYMIIPLNDKISFQWLSHIDEFYFKSVEELFSSNLINNIILNRDWSKVEEIWYY